jgi:hypothetical protein
VRLHLNAPKIEQFDTMKPGEKKKKNMATKIKQTKTRKLNEIASSFQVLVQEINFLLLSVLVLISVLMA